MDCQKLALAAARGGLASLLFAPRELPAQCAMCWQTLANSAEGASLIRGFHDGIVFLLAAPFLVVAILGFLLYNAQRPPVSADFGAEVERTPPGLARASGSEKSALPDRAEI